MKSHQSTIGLNDEWLTPPEILSKLGSFDLDPCSPKEPPWRIAERHFSQSGLEWPWRGRCWVNPPFNRYERPKWMKKMADHNNGILLIPAATETKAFFEHVWKRASAICFLYGRPHFHVAQDTLFKRRDSNPILVKRGERSPANCGCSIALVGYGEAEIPILQNSGLGHVVVL